jgi:hypothetical protein
MTTAKRVLLLMIVAVVPPFVLVIGGVFVFGSPRALVAWGTGEPLLIEVLHTGAAEYRLPVTNLRSHEISIVGIRADCLCTVIDDGPRRIAARQQQIWPIKVEHTNLANKRYVHVFTDVPSWREVQVTLTP